MRPPSKEAMMELGRNVPALPHLIRSEVAGCEQLVCAMYGKPDTAGEVNELRYQLFCFRANQAHDHELPPTIDALSLHVARSNYQSWLWRQALVFHPPTLSPVGNGWKLDNAGVNAFLVTERIV